MSSQNPKSEFNDHDMEPSILVKARRAVAKTFGVFTGTNLLPTVNLEGTDTKNQPIDPEAIKKNNQKSIGLAPAQFGKSEQSHKDKTFSESTNMNRMVKGFVQNEQQRRQVTQNRAPIVNRHAPRAIYMQRQTNVWFYLVWLIIAALLVTTIYAVKVKPLWYRQFQETFIRLKKPQPMNAPTILE